MAEKNSTILKNIWLNGTSDFQQRVPEPTQSDISETVRFLNKPMNRRYRNEFIDSLINRIGATMVRNSRMWDNPLAVFKSAALPYGSTIQEVATKWVKGHSYADEGAEELIFRMQRPEMAVAYHSRNVAVHYDISVSEPELRLASVDDYSLNAFISDILSKPENSWHYDEFGIMKQLMAEADAAEPYYKVHTDSVPTTEATAKDFLTDVRKYAGLFGFPSSRYSSKLAAGIPIFARPEELVLITTPEVKANIDVRALAAAFNLDFAQINPRIILIDEFPMPGVYAALTTDGYWIAADTYATTTSQYDPVGLKTNYFDHHQGIYSVSPFVPVVMWTTGDAIDNTTTVTQTVTGITVTPSADTVAAGGKVKLTVALNGKIAPETEGVSVRPSSVTLSGVTATNGDTAVDVSDGVWLTSAGYLHVGPDVATGAKITATVQATYINPSGTTTPYTATVNVTVA